MWYGAGRSWIEGLRTDSLYIPGTELRISQVVAAVSMIAGFIILLYNSARRHREPYVKRAAAAGAAAGAAAAAEELSAANEDGSAPAGDNIDQTDTVQEENNDA